MLQALGNFITSLIMAVCVNRVYGLASYLFDSLITQQRATENGFLFARIMKKTCEMLVAR